MFSLFISHLNLFFFLFITEMYSLDLLIWKAGECLNTSILSSEEIFGILTFIITDFRSFFHKWLWWKWFSFLAFQYDMMGRNQTAVREEMIRLANYLDSVSCVFYYRIILACLFTVSEQNLKIVSFWVLIILRTQFFRGLFSSLFYNIFYVWKKL